MRLPAKVLIANRGEIACRILRTLTAHGVRSVTLYHHEDRHAPHVQLSDEALRIEGRTPAAAYLDQEQILALSRECGADAVHPGYGFLAENAGFAEAVAAAGLTFIGPDAAAIRLMGDKVRAREFAAAQGLPLVPAAIMGDDEHLDAFAARAATIGFPLLIKATAGGGGKGMKVVHAAAELHESMELAASEAVRYFGNGRIYAEKLIQRPRHIEVQVFGDGRGGAIHLGMRDCSLQRRYQKIIEETPAPELHSSVCERICAAALDLVRAARYRNAGTVEFIVDAQGSFYFLEMNTRLQVEHPVTEAVYGIDLVLEQLRIAAGEGLTAELTRREPRGHAVECRVCAERPESEFEPATGVIGVLHVPVMEGVRIDIGVRQGQSVTAAFDSMLAKVIGFGATRLEAIDRLSVALRDMVVLGVDTNIDYVRAVLANERFRAGEVHTAFLQEHAAQLAAPPCAEEQQAAAAFALLLGDADFRRTAFDVPEPYASIGSWEN
jgi:propionyl-CoA carboxylase alpha chain/3-methylcrotonyl-CoA carboxylase alpha subunit/acetyl-CoA/propionyl-CoA carboxylase biotin carboxyl carrier protein